MINRDKRGMSVYKLLDNKAPTKKVSATIKFNGKEAKYVATATRENVIIYEDGEIVGGIYTTVKMMKRLGIRSEDSQVFGDWEDFEWVINDNEQPKDAKIEFDKKAVGNSNRVKGKEYKK